MRRIFYKHVDHCVFMDICNNGDLIIDDIYVLTRLCIDKCAANIGRLNAKEYKTIIGTEYSKLPQKYVPKKKQYYSNQNWQHNEQYSNVQYNNPPNMQYPYFNPNTQYLRFNITNPNNYNNNNNNNDNNNYGYWDPYYGNYGGYGGYGGNYYNTGTSGTSSNTTVESISSNDTKSDTPKLNIAQPNPTKPNINIANNYPLNSFPNNSSISPNHPATLTLPQSISSPILGSSNIIAQSLLSPTNNTIPQLTPLQKQSINGLTTTFSHPVPAIDILSPISEAAYNTVSNIFNNRKMDIYGFINHAFGYAKATNHNGIKISCIKYTEIYVCLTFCKTGPDGNGTTWSLASITQQSKNNLDTGMYSDLTKYTF